MSTVIDAYRSEKSSRVSTPDENSPFRRLKNPHPQNAARGRPTGGARLVEAKFRGSLSFARYFRPALTKYLSIRSYSQGLRQ